MGIFFRTAKGTPERWFRIGIFAWAVLFFSFAVFIPAVRFENIGYLAPMIFVGPAFIALTAILFVFALVRVGMTIYHKQYDLSVGYLAYCALVGLFIIPMVAGFFDK